MSHSHRRSSISRCLLANSSELWCHFGGEIRRQQSVTQRQGGLSPLKPQEDHTAAVFGHPRSAGQVFEVVPSLQPRMSPSLFASDCTGVRFFACWWCISMSPWGCLKYEGGQSYWKPHLQFLWWQSIPYWQSVGWLAPVFEKQVCEGGLLKSRV